MPGMTGLSKPCAAADASKKRAQVESASAAKRRARRGLGRRVIYGLGAEEINRDGQDGQDKEIDVLSCPSCPSLFEWLRMSVVLEDQTQAVLDFAAVVGDVAARDLAEGRVGEVHAGVLPVEVVEGVVGFEPRLKPEALGDAERLAQGHVGLPHARAVEAGEAARVG